VSDCSSWCCFVCLFIWDNIGLTPRPSIPVFALVEGFLVLVVGFLLFVMLVLLLVDLADICDDWSFSSSLVNCLLSLLSLPVS